MSQIEVCFCWATQLLEALLARCFCRGEGISGFELPTAEEANGAQDLAATSPPARLVSDPTTEATAAEPSPNTQFQ